MAINIPTSLMYMNTYYHYILVLTLLCFNTYASKLDYIIDHGENSCSIIATSSNIRDQRSYQKICSATVLSQNQIIVNNNCLASNRATTNYQLNCSNSLVRKYIFINTSGENNNLINLKFDLPYTPPSIKSFNGDNYQKCALKSAKRYINIIPADSNIIYNEKSKTISSSAEILGSTDFGAPVICTDKNGEEHTVGFLNENFKIIDLDEHIKKKGISISPFRPQYSETEDLQQKCIETNNCIKSLSEESIKLTSNILDILKELNKEIPKVNSITEIEDLEYEYEKIRAQCNKLTIEETKKERRETDQGLVDNAIGKVESGAISLFDSFLNLVRPDEEENTFLLSQFAKVPVIKENLRIDQIERIYEKYRNSNLSNIEKIRSLTYEFTKKIMTEQLLKMDLLRNNDQTYTIYVNEALINAKLCIDKANSKSIVLGCVEKNLAIAISEISKLELDNQIDENFKKHFAGKDEMFLQLKTKASDTFYRCIKTKALNQDQIDMATKAKACVFESILTAYNYTKKDAIREYLKAANTKSSELEHVLNDILRRSDKCTLSTTINSTNKKGSYEYLKSLEAEAFKDYLDKCIEVLSIEAGKDITEQSIINNTQLIENIKNKEKIANISNVAGKRSYKKCIDAQTGKKDPANCSEYITSTVVMNVIKDVILSKISEIGLSKTSEYTHKEKYSDAIDKCIRSNENTSLEKLRNKDKSKSSTDYIQCLSGVISELSKDISEITLNIELENNLSTKEHIKEIKLLEEIISLPLVTKKCFEGNLVATSIDKFISSINNAQEICTFETERIAVGAIAPAIIELKLSEKIDDQTIIDTIKNDYLTKNGILRNRIRGTKDKLGLDRIIEGLTKEFTVIAAQAVIPKLIKQYLPNDLRASEIERRLTNYITGCIETSSTQEDSGKCINSTTIIGYKDIASILIEDNINKFITEDDGKKEEIKSAIFPNYNTCLDNISTGLSDNEFDEKIFKCLKSAVKLTQTLIPKAAISAYKEALEIDNTDEVLNKHNKCINQKVAPSENKVKNINEYMDLYTVCNEQLEHNVKQEIANRFAKAFSISKSDLKNTTKLGETITELSSNNENNNKKNSSLKETAESIKMLGLLFAPMCNSNKKECETIVDQTKTEVLTFKSNNPKASQQQLMEVFYKTPVIENIIYHEFSKVLSQALKDNLVEYNDKSNYLYAQIESATTPEKIIELIKSDTNKGNKILELITESVKNETINDLSNNIIFKQELSKVLVADISDDSFIDKLLGGIIQPMLSKERKSSSGLLGIFRNTKVAMGRLFGIVDGKDFKWEKIKSTKEGQEARRIFAKEIFENIVAGVDLEKIPATNKKKYDSRLEELSSEIEELIVSGLKEL